MRPPKVAGPIVRNVSWSKYEPGVSARTDVETGHM
jgi:hypothetical protein